MPAVEHKPLAGPLAIIVIAGVLVAVLVLLFPGRRDTQSFENAKTYDSASLSYLETLLKVTPQDDKLRLAYAHQLLERGEFNKTQEVLSGLVQPDAPAAEIMTLQLRLAQYDALKAGDPHRVQAKQQVERAMQALKQVPAGTLSDVQMQDIAKHSLAFGLPAQGAYWYGRLARRHPDNSYQWWALAGKWWLAAGKPQRALDAWQHAQQAASTPQQASESEREMLMTARMSGGGKSLGLIEQGLAKHRRDPELLQAGIAAALAANEPQQALSWAQQLAALKPNDEAAQRQLGRAALANGQLDEALKIYQKLGARHPDDTGLQRRLGQLFLWTGHPDQALPYYLAQARIHPTAAGDRELIRIGRAVPDYPVVVAALLRENQRHRLSVQDMTELVDNFSGQLGEPYRTIEVLKAWLGSTAADRPLWHRLATMYAQTDQPDKAEKTWRHIMALYGRNVSNTTALAMLQVESWQIRPALKTLLTLLEPGAALPTDPTYWQNLGAVANQQADLPVVTRAYGWLLEHGNGELDAGSALRLVQAELALGHVDHAAQVVEKIGAKKPDASLLLQVLATAQATGRMDIVRRLLVVASRHPQVFEGDPQYWNLLGDIAADRRRYGDAREDYLYALQLAPDNASSKVALLSVLMTQRDSRALADYLSLWYADAADSPGLWESYAMGYSQLGEPDLALPFYERRAKANPTDYLWLLSYADALDAARMFDDGYRMRLFALTRLRPALLKRLKLRETQAQRQRDAQILSEQQALLGGAQNLAWLQRVLTTPDARGLSPTDHELLVHWHLSADQPRFARYWLLRAQMRRLRMPEYQKLSVALASSDYAAIGAILAHSTAPGVADRVAGWQRIHQKGKALLLALNHINPREPWSSGVDSLPKYAAELYQNMPQNAGVELVATRAGGLLLSTELASIKRSTQDWTLAVQARTTQLTHRGIALLMSGLTHEYAVLAKLTHRGRRSTQTVELGRVDTAVGGFTQAALQFGYQFTGRLSGDIFARYNDQTLDSSYFRVLGTRDSAGVDLDYTLSARDSVSLRAQGLRYQSHWNDFLGTGWSIDTNFRRALKVGQSYEVDAYTGLSYVHNNLVRTLPLRVAARLPTGSGPTTLLAPNFGFAGVGLALSRGMPGTDYPTVGGLRYHADLGLGYVWPDDRIGVAFTGSVGHRILGSDELSAFFHFDQTQNETGGTNLMVGVQYRYFLGK